MIFESITRSVIAFVIVLGTLVLLHEGGHYLIAKLLRFPVAVFSIGFGKRIWGFTRRGTEYRISILPLGGYVKIVGLGPDESNLGLGASEGPPRSRAARIAIYSAGPLANLILAIVLIAISYTLGREVPGYLAQPVVVAAVGEDSPAAKAGLRRGDTILAVDDKALPTWDEFFVEIGTSGGENREFTYRRDGQTATTSIAIDKAGAGDFGVIGVAPDSPVAVERVSKDMPAESAGLRPGDVIVAVEGVPVSLLQPIPELIAHRADQATRFTIERARQRLEIPITPRRVNDQVLIGVQLRASVMVLKQYPLRRALQESWRENRDAVRRTFGIVGKMLRAKVPVKQMSGPLEIARFAGEESKEGPSRFIAFMGMVSLQLAVFNILPLIPILDGFQILLLLIESVMRRDLSLEIKERMLQVGFVAVVMLMVAVFYFDVVKSLAERGAP